MHLMRKCADAGGARRACATRTACSEALPGIPASEPAELQSSLQYCLAVAPT